MERFGEEPGIEVDQMLIFQFESQQQKHEKGVNRLQRRCFSHKQLATLPHCTPPISSAVSVALSLFSCITRKFTTHERCDRVQDNQTNVVSDDKRLERFQSSRRVNRLINRRQRRETKARTNLCISSREFWTGIICTDSVRFWRF